MALTFQHKVIKWCKEAFGEKDALDKRMRALRFLEEALELVQAGGLTYTEAQRVLAYVYSRPVGKLEQEVGGTMVSLAAMVGAHGLHMYTCGENELVRCWQKIEIIRQRHALKPTFWEDLDTGWMLTARAAYAAGYSDGSARRRSREDQVGVAVKQDDQFPDALKCECGAALIMASEKQSGHCEDCVRIRS